MRILLVVLIVVALWAAGCSGGDMADPVLPSERAVESAESHSCWGVWQFAADPQAGTLDMVRLRTGNFHLNALPFLEPPPFANLSLESLEFNGNLITAGIGLRHPFLGLTEFTGFDVCGIFITNGSVSGFEDSGIVLAGPDDAHLLNPDGYSRWWNPTEFPHGTTMFSYKDGLLGTPDDVANFSGRVNAYKYFCDEIDENDPIGNVDPMKRGVFHAGSKNIRIYEIDLGTEGLIFNYAIDACWQFPTGGKPWEVPGDFAEGANRAEAWNIAVNETSNTLFNDGVDSGGELHLAIDVYDWFNADLNTVKVESPGNFGSVTSATPAGGGIGYSTYAIDIMSASPQAPGVMDILISVASEEADFEGFISGTNTTAYFIHKTVVAGELPEYIEIIIPNGGEEWPAGSSQEITWNSGTGTANVMIEYSKDDFVADINEIIDSTPNDGSFDWDPVPFDPTTTAKVRITDVDNATIYDVSDDYFSITVSAIYVDDSNTSGVEDGSIDHPYNTIQEGLAAASAGYYVLVDDSGVDYTGPVTLVADVILKSQNWDGTDGDDEASIYYDSSSSAVNGADNASIEGFEIDGSRYGIDCNGTSPEIIDCRIVNLRYSDCTGVWLRNGSFAHLDGVEVYDLNNNTDYGYATFYGIRIDNCDAAGSDNVLIEHTIVHHVFSSDIIGLGGGYCDPHGIYINNSDGVQVRNSVVHDVTGGNYHEVFGIRVASSTDVELVNVVIYDVDKTYYNGTGYGLHFTSCINLDARNMIISHVHKGEGGTGGYYQTAYGVYQSGSTYSFEYCDVYDCQNGNYNGVTPGVGCISSNPFYVDPGTDFHLQSGSPCIDAGDPAAAYNDTDGSRNDMGCYGGPEGDW